MAAVIQWPKPLPQFDMITADELESLPPPEWLIDNILELNASALLFGPPGKGKSLAALDMALCVATGLDWHGHKVKQGPVLYIVGEDAGGMGLRVKAWRHAHRLSTAPINIRFITKTMPQLADASHIDALIANLQHSGFIPRLIVLDTFARAAVGVEENSAKEMGLWVAGMTRMQAALSATMMPIHHTGKGEETERGSTSLTAAVHTRIKVTKSGDTITIANPKQRNASEFEALKFKLEPVDLPNGLGSMILTGATNGMGSSGLTANQMRLLHGLARCTSIPAPLKEWRDQVDNDGQRKVPKKTFENWTNDLKPEYVHSPTFGQWELTNAGRNAANAKCAPTTEMAQRPQNAANATTP